MHFWHEIRPRRARAWKDQPVTDEAAPYPPLCRALRIASIETGVSQTELARRLGERQNRITRYFNDREPSHEMVQRIEDAMELPSGWLLAMAGYLRMPRTRAEWDAIDPAISEDGKLMLAQLYEQLSASFRLRHGGEKNMTPIASMNSSRRASS